MSSAGTKIEEAPKKETGQKSRRSWLRKGLRWLRAKFTEQEAQVYMAANFKLDN